MHHEDLVALERGEAGGDGDMAGGRARGNCGFDIGGLDIEILARHAIERDGGCAIFKTLAQDHDPDADDAVDIQKRDKRGKASVVLEQGSTIVPTAEVGLSLELAVGVL
jgi:hypothetical protein